MPIRSFGSVSKAELAKAKSISAPAVPLQCSTDNLVLDGLNTKYAAYVGAAGDGAVMTFCLPPTLTRIESIYIFASTGSVYNPANPMRLTLAQCDSEYNVGGASGVLNQTIILPVYPALSDIVFSPDAGWLAGINAYWVAPLNMTPWTVQLSVLFLAAGGGSEATDLNVEGGVLLYS